MFRKRFVALLAAAFLLRSAPLNGGPPPVHVSSGKALNTLLQDISAAHVKGRRGPVIKLEAAVLKQINVAPPRGGNFALLRGGGKLHWPKALASDPFKAERKK